MISFDARPESVRERLAAGGRRSEARPPDAGEIWIKSPRSRLVAASGKWWGGHEFQKAKVVYGAVHGNQYPSERNSLQADPRGGADSALRSPPCAARVRARAVSPPRPRPRSSSSPRARRRATPHTRGPRPRRLDGRGRDEVGRAESRENSYDREGRERAPKRRFDWRDRRARPPAVSCAPTSPAPHSLSACRPIRPHREHREGT